MGDGAPTPPRSEPTRWPGGDRAAVLFVGIPLMAALVLAATPLSEPPALTAVAALGSPVVGLKPAAAQRVVGVAVPSRAPARLRGAAAVRARVGLSARAVVRVAESLERADSQAP